MASRTCRTLALLLIFVATSPAGGRPVHPRYLGPVGTKDGRVFPVARTNWYSVINFANDWHAPRMRLVEGKWKQIGVHEGNDIFAEPNTPVFSVTSGTVENVGWTFYSGWRVGVRGDDGKYWFYAHLSRFARGIVPGVRVVPGMKLGNVGNTGYGNDPGHRNEFTWHLHFGIQRADGSWMNPYPLVKRLYRIAVAH
ncbi:MAG: M23 family metallopeptidase [Actinomycetota bacterium]|nr:M23 family metallopeptidase [Actinomycetota bacterium]